MQKNVAGQKIGAQLIDATTGAAFTGAVTVSVTIDAGTQATGSVGSGACAHEGNGYHTYAPAQAETNGALLAFTFVGTGAVPATVQVFTTGYDPTAAQIPANVAQWTGTNVASPDTSGYPKVTIKSGTGTGEVSLSSGLVRLSATGVDDIWDEATAGHATAGTTGKALTDAGSAGSPPSAAAIADAVWDEATAGHSTAGTTGKALTDAGSAGTPPSAGTIADAVWDEARAGHVASGSFGESVVLSASERNAAADALLNRSTSSITESAAPKKSLYAAIAKLTHKTDSAAGTLTVMRSDDSTPHFTQVETTDAAADPLTGLGGAA